jgi:hypothetical protein
MVQVPEILLHPRIPPLSLVRGGVFLLPLLPKFRVEKLKSASSD